MPKEFGYLIKNLSSDVVAIAVIIIAVVSYGLYRGKENLVSLLVSLYIGMVAYTSSPFLKSLLFFKQNNTQVFFSKLIVYLILVVVINIVMNRVISPSFAMTRARNYIEIALLAIAVSASAIVIAFNTLSLSLAYTPSLISGNILASSTALFSTLISSLVIIFFCGR